MIIRRPAEKHLGRCGGQGSDFLEAGKATALVPLAELRERKRMQAEIVVTNEYL